MSVSADAMAELPAASRRRVPASVLLPLAAFGLLAVGTLSLAIGPTGISLASLPHALGALIFGSDDAQALRDRLVLLDLRLPRTLLGAFVGAALAVGGAILQGLFRNPLADPALVGVSSGAALGAAATIAFGNHYAAPFMQAAGVYAVSVAAFAGGIATTLVLVALAGRSGRLAIGTLLLTGIAMGAIADSLRGFIAFASDDRELRDLTLWSLGSLTGASWPKVLAVTPFAIVLLLALPRLVRALNGFLLGEAEAFHLGVNVESTKRLAVLVSAAAVGAAVASAGIVAFVGLIVPHIIRLVAGPDHRVVLPAAALLGGLLVLTADIIARMAVRPAELPLGVVMAAIGAPVFLHLVLRRGLGSMD
ncbi:MAG: FecCD family ABC transporter permease [Hyphomicrobiaceae bacterium]